MKLSLHPVPALTPLSELASRVLGSEMREAEQRLPPPPRVPSFTADTVRPPPRSP
jgi:hypothetical protein